MSPSPLDAALAYWRGLGAPLDHVARRLGLPPHAIAAAHAAAAPMPVFPGYPSATPWPERTIDRVIRRGLARPAAQPLIHLGGEGSLTTGEVAALVARLCAGLSAHGIGPAAPVAVDATQRLESYLLALAALLLGAPLVRLAGHTDADGLCQRLEAAPAALTVSASIDATAGLAAAGLRLGLDDATAPSFLDWLDACPAADALPQIHISPADTALIGFTSGSTGTPKCIHTSHEAVFRSSEAMHAQFAFTADDIFCTATDFSALSALRSLITMPFLSGGQVMLPSAAARTSPLALALEAQAFGVTRLTAVPNVLRGLAAAHARIGPMPRLRMALSGSGILDQPTQDRFQAAFAVPAVDYYGVRELGTTLYADPTHPGTLSSAGGLPNNALIRLADDDGNEVATGTIGQLMVHSDTMMQHLAPARHAAWQGWHETGDLGRADATGRIQIVGRRREVIKARDGTLVFPIEVEALLQALPGVREAAAFGHTTDAGIEHIIAAIILDTPLEDPATTVRRHVLAAGGQQRVPSLVVTLPDFPRVASLKPDRARLRTQLAAQLVDL